MSVGVYDEAPVRRALITILSTQYHFCSGALIKLPVAAADYRSSNVYSWCPAKRLVGGVLRGIVTKNRLHSQFFIKLTSTCIRNNMYSIMCIHSPPFPHSPPRHSISGLHPDVQHSRTVPSHAPPSKTHQAVIKGKAQRLGA